MKLDSYNGLSKVNSLCNRIYCLKWAVTRLVQWMLFFSGGWVQYLTPHANIHNIIEQGHEQWYCLCNWWQEQQAHARFDLSLTETWCNCKRHVSRWQKRCGSLKDSLTKTSCFHNFFHAHMDNFAWLFLGRASQSNLWSLPVHMWFCTCLFWDVWPQLSISKRLTNNAIAGACSRKQMWLWLSHLVGNQGVLLDHQEHR
jgi:hypothetical protein